MPLRAPGPLAILLLLAAALSPSRVTASSRAAFQALHGEAGSSASHSQILGTFNKNRLIAEVHSFYSKVDQRTPPQELRGHVDAERIHSVVRFVKVLKESHTFAEFSETLEGVYAKYPVVDRTLDRFEVEQLSDDRYSVRFRLTSVILRPETGDVRFAFRASMRFDYAIGEDGRPRIVEYIATPQLSTASKTLWERIKDMF